MPAGGARKGSGRKVGSVTSPFRKKLMEFLADPSVEKDFFEGLRGLVAQKDRETLKWLGDQGAGRARQAIDLTNDGEPFEDYALTDDQLRRALARKHADRLAATRSSENVGESEASPSEEVSENTAGGEGGGVSEPTVGGGADDQARAEEPT